MSDGKKTWEKINSSIAEVEKRLDLPAGFLKKLADESPWSFIIKLHALIEGALTHNVREVLNVGELEDWAESLSLRGRHSKLSLLNSFGQLEKWESKFINTLADIRNDLIHKVGNVTFEYEAYFAALEDGKRTATLNALSFCFAEESDGPANLEPISKDPQRVIFNGGRVVLALASLRIQYLEKKNETTELKLSTAEMATERRALFHKLRAFEPSDTSG